MGWQLGSISTGLAFIPPRCRCAEDEEVFILQDDGVLACGTQPSSPRSALHMLEGFWHSSCADFLVGKEGNPPSLQCPGSAQPEAVTLELLSAYMAAGHQML